MLRPVARSAQGTSGQQAQVPPTPSTSTYQPPPDQPAEPPQQVQPNSYPNGTPRKSALRQPSEASPSELAPRFALNPSSTDTSQSRDTARQRRRNSSPDTLDTLQSPSSGMSSFDIVSFPVIERQRGRGPLSVIPEGSSIRSGTPSRHSEAPSPSLANNVPAWVTNPPVDFSKRQDVEQWRRGSSNAVSCSKPSVSYNLSELLSPLGY